MDWHIVSAFPTIEQKTLLTPSMLADDILKHISYFPRKQASIVHTTCLLKDNLYEISKPDFWKTKEENINLSSAVLATE